MDKLAAFMRRIPMEIVALGSLWTVMFFTKWSKGNSSQEDVIKLKIVKNKTKTFMEAEWKIKGLENWAASESDWVKCLQMQAQ